jgi:hypothetical protein
MSHNTTALVLDLKSAYEGEHMIFVLLSLAKKWMELEKVILNKVLNF